MTTREQIKKLAGEGYTVIMMAEKIGVSRARIYQIIKEEAILLVRSELTIRRGLPVPGVVTGGIVGPVNSATAGTISEVLAAADLLARGWHVYTSLVRHKGHDLIAVKGDRIVTVEVRSAHLNQSQKAVFLKQPPDNSDFYALVVTGSPVIYQPEIE